MSENLPSKEATEGPATSPPKSKRPERKKDAERKGNKKGGEKFKNSEEAAKTSTEESQKIFSTDELEKMKQEKKERRDQRDQERAERKMKNKVVSTKSFSGRKAEPLE